jgi:HD superfamily phosphodiesterase
VGDQIPDDVIESALEVAREALGMDAAHLGTFVADCQEIQQISGEAGRFGLRRGLRVPLEDTFCKRMLAGEIPQVVPDAAGEPALRHVPAARDGLIQAYVGVPVTASDGTVFGSFCCLSDHADPSLQQRDITFLRVLGRLVGDRLQRQKLEARERERLEDLVARRTEELESAQAETAMRLSRAIEFRDDDTGSHIERVGIMSELLARAAGADESFCRLIRMAAPLHDLGKVAAPDQVLLKPGALTKRERELMQAHAEIGHRLLADSSSALLKLAASIARTHHERIDGGGYSRRLHDDEIPLEGRIVAIADVFDALTRDRVYRTAVPVDEAIAIMRSDTGHFDPELLGHFVDEVVPSLPFDMPAHAG